MRINLWALDQLFYLHLDGDNLLCLPKSLLFPCAQGHTIDRYRSIRVITGRPPPWGVRFLCSGLYSSLLEVPRVERKDSLSVCFCVPDSAVLVRSIGMC